MKRGFRFWHSTFGESLICLMGGILSTLIFSLFFWGFGWLMEEPFEKLGIIKVYVSLVDYSSATIRMDYVMQSLLLLVFLIIHGMLFYLCYKAIEQSIS